MTVTPDACTILNGNDGRSMSGGIPDGRHLSLGIPALATFRRAARMSRAHGVSGAPPGTPTAIFAAARVGAPPIEGPGTVVRSTTLAHTPLRSGLPSWARGTDASRFGLPSAVLGTPGKDVFNHCAPARDGKRVSARS